MAIPMLSSTLTALQFSPELAPLLVTAGTPTLRPNPHPGAFLKILLEEINKSYREKAIRFDTDRRPRQLPAQ